MQCVKLYSTEELKMQNSSPDVDPAIIYNDSGYFTTHQPQSFSSNSNSDPSFEEVSLHSKNGECSVQNGVYFCEDTNFEEPKFEGPPLLSNNTNNYEQFSSLIKFSLEESSSSYLNNINLQDSSSVPVSTNVLQYFDDSLSSLSSINPSQPICVSDNGENTETSVNNKVFHTPTKKFINPVNPNLSPELFSEDETETNEQIVEIETSVIDISFTQKHSSPNEQYLKNDRKLLKRVQETLSGVPPPPSVTILQLSVEEMLTKIYSYKDLFLSAKSDDTNLNNKCSGSTMPEEKTVKSLLICSSKEEVEEREWPEIMNCRFHGLYHNRSKTSEDLEEACQRYLSRYVGAETSSLCTWPVAPGSASKRRAARLRWAPRSPGRRLSHLARRRITFSSASLHQQQSVLGNSAVRGQIMIDPRRPVQPNRRRSPRKSPRKSPWKKSPRKSPRKTLKTPNSSAKKRSARRLNMEDDAKPGSSKMSSTKRALFQSPEQKVDRKRKRSDDDAQPTNKFPRSLSFDVNHASAMSSGVVLPRRHSEVIVRATGREGLSDLHKQKMLWAVSEALRAQQISMTHPQFRSYASILCKVIKNRVPDLMSNGPRQPGSTSDRMLRIARHHSYSVTRGKTYEEIMLQIKETNANLKNLKPPSGYIAPESARSQSKNVLQDKVMNIESNQSKKSPDMKTAREEYSKLRSIRRQIVFDDNEITKTCNSDR